MMDFNAVLAGLSAAAYVEGKADDAIVGLPPGVTRLPGALSHTPPSVTGFEASAFRYGDKIIIAYAGTGDYGDAVADLALANGIPEGQIAQAAQYYQQVKAWAIAQYGAGYADNIVFTGHSLGGGLAALMGVFFDKQAVTFDPAPFRLSATTTVASAIASYIRLNGNFVDSDLATFTATTAPVLTEIPALDGRVGHRCWRTSGRGARAGR